MKVLTSLETSFLFSKFLTGLDEGARLLGPRTERLDSVILLLRGETVNTVQ